MIKQYAKPFIIVLAGAAVAGASASYILGREEKRVSDVVYRSGVDVPDPAQVGTPDATVERAHELIALLRKSDWKIDTGFPMHRLVVDDQRYAEFPQDRKQTTSFGVPKPQPPYQDVAVICDTYVRKNIVARRDGSSSRAPTGFFIVGFKDGRVEKISVDKVRVKEYRVEGSSMRRFGMVFPGTQEYDENLPPYTSSIL